MFKQQSEDAILKCFRCGRLNSDPDQIICDCAMFKQSVTCGDCLQPSCKGCEY